MSTPFKRPVEQGGRFRVLIGTHLDQGPAGCECQGCLGDKGRNHLYRARLHEAVRVGPNIEGPDAPDWDGDIINSKVDLCARFNMGPNSTKFERVREDAVNVPYQPQQPSYDGLSLAQLIAIAQEEEIDLKGASKREEVLKLVKAGMAQAVHA